MRFLFTGIVALAAGFCGGGCSDSPAPSTTFDPLAWERAVDNPVFTTDFVNNHDAMFFVNHEQEFPYHLIVCSVHGVTQLWRTKTFSWTSADWQLVDANYSISRFYEHDDAIKVGDTYFIFEEARVFTSNRPFEESSGQWVESGTFPRDIDDVGVFYENGIFHLFGEYGDFPHGPDGTSLAHYTSSSGVGDWTLVDTHAVNPNPDGGNTFGVGDATITKIDDIYYIFCDRESLGVPYRITAWRSYDIDEPFEYLGVAIAPRSTESDDWDNHRMQDADIEYVPELGGYVMFCNMMDLDGDPQKNFPVMTENFSRVIGVLYNTSRDQF